ncbi:hypothetical protein PAPYR_1647 [Paratrimastix pyriformis]|uniref:RING-type domain-containing protein n=1 Tax=Paratrimastix pyriformis TaxID=342808 RepID=A0ABQ8UU45_9EUKA|nr:hypothetical protein PAPYR_1647 [Paratrimastix pyriformis]
MAKQGFPDERFVHRDELFEDLSCPICLCVMRDPILVCQHSHKACDACGRLWTTDHPTCPACGSAVLPKLVPDVFARAVINRLQVFCVNKQFGCDWQGKVEDSQLHEERQCPRRIVGCSHPGCGFQCRLNDELIAHSDGCPHRPIICRHCLLTLLLGALAAHNEGCTRFPVTCPYRGCGATVPRNEMPQHEAACSHKPITCRHCRLDQTQGELEAHNEKCPRFPVVCPFGCGASVPRNEMPQHQTTHPEVVSARLKAAAAEAEAKKQKKKEARLKAQTRLKAEKEEARQKATKAKVEARRAAEIEASRREVDAIVDLRTGGLVLSDDPSTRSHQQLLFEPTHFEEVVMIDGKICNEAAVALVQLLENNCDPSHLRALTLVHDLAITVTSNVMGRAGIARPLTRMLTHPSIRSPRAAESLFRAIADLACDDVNRTFFGEAGVAPSLVEMLRDSNLLSRIPATTELFRAIANLSMNNPANRAAFGEARIAEPIADQLVRLYEAPDRVTVPAYSEQLLKAFAALTFDPRIREVFAQRNIVATVGAILERECSPVAQEELLRALNNFFPIVPPEICGLLSGLLVTPRSPIVANPSLATQYFAFVSRCVSDDGLRETLGQQRNFITPLVQLVSEPAFRDLLLQDPEIHRWYCAALRSLAENPNNRAKILEARAPLPDKFQKLLPLE